MSELELSIRDLISQFVAGSISAAELNDSLPDPWDLDQANEPALTELVMDVVGLLAGFQAGDTSEAELRTALAPETSWRVDRAFTSAASFISQEPVETEVREDAGTPPQVVSVP